MQSVDGVSMPMREASLTDAKPLPAMVTTGWLAKRLGVERRTLSRWVKRGVIPGTLVGKDYKIRMDEFRIRCPSMWQFLLEEIENGEDFEDTD